MSRKLSANKLTVAAIQTSYGPDMKANIKKTEALITKAAKKGAKVILPSELFQGPYFCTSQKPEWFKTAFSVDTHPCVLAMQKLAKKLGVVIPTSFFEKDGPRYFNSVALIDHKGRVMGVYRKSHIPDGPGYQEKYYFRPGDTGYKVWDTKFGKIGVAICWDQWYAEPAVAMAKAGADILLYPTAIGSEPYDTSLDTRSKWQRVHQGWAASLDIPVVAANRIGKETVSGVTQNYYGGSFIADHTGALVENLDRQEGILTHTFDLGALEEYRADWGHYRDRRDEFGSKAELVRGVKSA